MESQEEKRKRKEEISDRIRKVTMDEIPAEAIKMPLTSDRPVATHNREGNVSSSWQVCQPAPWEMQVCLMRMFG